LKKVIRNCPICSCEKGKVLHTQRFNKLSDNILPDSYDVIACSGCSFVYADTPANQSDYDRYYAELSKYEDIEVSSGGSTPWDNERYAKLVSDISPFLSKKSAILDIGCANGGLLNFLNEQGYENLTGLDPSAKCVSYVSMQGIKAVRGDIFNNSLITDKIEYDFVIFSHVFEHLYDLKKAVQYVSSYLKEGGLVYIEVPDASRYKDFYVVPYYYFDSEHINHFSEHSLTNLFLQSNFEFVKYEQKEIPVSNTAKYPALYGLYRKVVGLESLSINRDKPNDLTVKSIIEYINKSNYGKEMQDINDLAQSQESIIVWGAGQYTLRLMSETCLKDCNIVAFIDKDKKKQGQAINDIQVYPPEYLLNEKFSGPIIISSALFSEDIIIEIREMGLVNHAIVVK